LADAVQSHGVEALENVAAFTMSGEVALFLEESQEFLKACLSLDPSARPSAGALQELPFLRLEAPCVDVTPPPPVLT
jgi:hypothetical protein